MESLYDPSAGIIGRELETYMIRLDPTNFRTGPVEGREGNRFEFDACILRDVLVEDRFCMFDDITFGYVVADAQDSVPLQQSHLMSDLSIGESFAAELRTGADGKKEVISSIYIFENWDLAGSYTFPNTDIFIEGIKFKKKSDVSVQLWGGTRICSICECDIWDYRACSHWPGKEYEVGPNKEKTLCYYTICGAHLIEISLVSDGAVPGAMVVKAQAALDANVPLERVQRVFKAMYPRVDISQELYNRRSFTVSKKHNDKERANMDPVQVITQLKAQHPELAIPDDPGAALTYFSTQYVSEKQKTEAAQAQVTSLTQANVTLQTQAASGQAFRQSEITRATQAYTKAYGEPLTLHYQSEFAKPETPVEQITKYADQWEKEAAQKAPPQQHQGAEGGGQKTVGGGFQQQLKEGAPEDAAAAQSNFRTVALFPTGR